MKRNNISWVRETVKGYVGDFVSLMDGKLGFKDYLLNLTFYQAQVSLMHLEALKDFIMTGKEPVIFSVEYRQFAQKELERLVEAEVRGTRRVLAWVERHLGDFHLGVKKVLEGFDCGFAAGLRSKKE
jgi:hypothetical protein